MRAFSRLSGRLSKCSLKGNWVAAHQTAATCQTCQLQRRASSSMGEVLFKAREAVKPGDTVVLRLTSLAQVAVKCGDHEAFDLQIVDYEAGGAGASSLEVTRSSSSEGRGTLTFQESSSQQGIGACIAQARSPARFVSLDISTAGGDVFVESVKEADLVVESGGGSITVPSIKGDHAVLRSMGGAISGSLTAAQVTVDTQGGPLHLKGLVGKAVAVDSSGGPLSVGACYAEEAALRSGGGPVVIGTLKCDAGLVESAGGPIAVDGVQGSAELSSGGGSIQVHVQPDTGRLELSSGGGGISLLITPGMPGRILYPQGLQLSLPPELLPPPQAALNAAPRQLQLVLQPSNSVGVGGRPCGPPLSRLQASQGGHIPKGQPPPVIEIKPGAGAVSVRQCSWIEAMQHKLAKGGGR